MGWGRSVGVLMHYVCDIHPSSAFCDTLVLGCHRMIEIDGGGAFPPTHTRARLLR
eukprot:SAG25_NODE_1408_length_3100_cov_1.806065_5_plen_55_part_00